MNTTEDSMRTAESSSETKGRFKVKNVKPNADSQDLIIQNLKTDGHGNGITVGELKHSTTLTGVAFSSAQGARPSKVVDNIAGSVISSQNQKAPIPTSSSAPHSVQQQQQQQQQNLAFTNSTTNAGQNAVQNVPSIEKDASGADAVNPLVDPLLRSVASAQSWPVAAPAVPKKSRFTVKTIPVVEKNDTVEGHKDTTQSHSAPDFNLNHTAIENPGNILLRLEQLFEMNAQMLARVLEATKGSGLDTPSPSPHIIERSPTPQHMQQFPEGHRNPLPQPPASHVQSTSSPQCTVTPPLAGSAGAGNNPSSIFLSNSSGNSQVSQVNSNQPITRPPSLTTMPSPYGTPHAPQAHYSGLISAESGSIFNTNSPTGSSGTPPLPGNPTSQRSSPSVNTSTTVSGIVTSGVSGTQSMSGASGVTNPNAPSQATTSTHTGTQNNCSGVSATGSGVIGVLGSSGQGLGPSTAPQGPSLGSGSGSGILAPTPGSSSNSSLFAGSNAEKDKASAFGKLFHYMNEMKKELEVAQKQRREGQLETQRLREKCQQLDDRLAMEHSKSAGLEDRLERAKVTQRTLRSQTEAQAAQISVLLDAHAQAVLEKSTHSPMQSDHSQQQLSAAQLNDYLQRSDEPAQSSGIYCQACNIGIHNKPERPA